MKTRKQILAILKVNSLRAILKRQKPTQIEKRYYITLDADQTEIHVI